MTSSRVATAGALAFLCMAASPVRAQTADNAGNTSVHAWQPYTDYFDTALTGDSIVGGSVALVDGGRIGAMHNYGFADRVRRQVVDDSTIFHWGSITKTLAAIAIMQLRDRGKLSLDDPVTRYVPELRRVHDPYGPVDSITIKMLLSHSAGFQFVTWPYKHGRSWEPFEPTTWDQLVAMLPYEEVAFRPGSQYAYSNPAFIYLARITEAVTGDPWELYVQKNIFTPLGMDRSYFGYTPYHLEDHRSANYTVTRDSSGMLSVIDNGREFDPGITMANGGWNAPLADLVKYTSFLMGAAQGDTALQRRYDMVLRHATLEEMWRPLYTNVAHDREGVAMGLSFFTLGDDPHRVIGHTGSQAGFLAFMYINPATRRAIVASINTANHAQPAGTLSAYTRIRNRGAELIR